MWRKKYNIKVWQPCYFEYFPNWRRKFFSSVFWLFVVLATRLLSKAINKGSPINDVTEFCTPFFIGVIYWSKALVFSLHKIIDPSQSNHDVIHGTPFDVVLIFNFQVSISPAFYEQLFHAKVFCRALCDCNLVCYLLTRRNKL